MSGDKASRNHPEDSSVGAHWNELNPGEQDAIDRINTKAVAKEELVTPMIAAAGQAEEEYRGNADKKKHDCAFNCPAPLKGLREVEKSDMAKEKEVVAERLTPGKTRSRSSAQQGDSAEENHREIDTNT